MKHYLPGSRIIITGASSGIGRELSLQLATIGAKLIITARRKERLTEVISQIQTLAEKNNFTPYVKMVVGDITQPEVRQAVIHCAEETYGGLDILINNAGAAASGLFEHSTPETLQKVLDLNVISLVEMTRLALPFLKGEKGTVSAQTAPPLIVNLSSIVGIHGVSHYSEYCAAKFAVRGFSQSLRIELRRYGIGVLTVCPGSTETEFFTRYIENTSEPVFPPHKRVSAKYVARKIISAMKAGKREIIPFFLGKVLRATDYYIPNILENALAKYSEQKNPTQK
ncbi:MAG: SDR family NAD(P)-dependent oxidoreductase [Planctomycetia bacterium]|nr:SDR family NAD(P)-dependent oxidoreductase [Planctomycetia bacterium]